MRITAVNQDARYVGIIGSGQSTTFNFDTKGGDTLLVAVGWSDAVDGGIPAVSFNGVSLQMVTTRPVSSIGTMAIFVLGSLPNGPFALEVSGSGYLGVTQILTLSLAGGMGIVGKVATGNTTGSQTETTTTLTINDAASTSADFGFVFSFWYGANVTMTVGENPGLPAIVSNYGTDASGNGFCYAFEISSGGATTIPFTPTPSNGAYPTYVAMLVEVPLYGTVNAAVTVTNSATQSLGSLTSTSTAPAITFDCKDGDLLLVAVTCSYNKAVTPALSYAGTTMVPVTNPRISDANLGNSYLYMLSAPTGGGANPLTLTYSGFLGTTQISIVALKGANDFVLGSRIATIEQSSSATTLSIPNVSARSTLLAFIMCEYSNPSSMSPSYGWTQLANAQTSNTASFVFACPVASAAASVDLQLTPSIYSQYFEIIVEVYHSGIGPSLSSATVDISNQTIVDVGVIGNGSATVTFDPKLPAAPAFNQPTHLLIFIGWDNPSKAPDVTFAGNEVRLLPQLTLTTPNVGSVACGIVPWPSGPGDIVITGHLGYYGDAIVAVAATTGISGLLGDLHLLQNSGTVTDLPVLKSSVGGRYQNIVFAFASFQSAQAIASEGWNTIGVSGAGGSGWLFTTTSDISGIGALEVLHPAYEQVSYIALSLPEAPSQQSDVFAGSNTLINAPTLTQGSLTEVGIPKPNGQVYHMYLETWFRALDSSLNPQPQDFVLAKTPAFIDTIILSFAWPQCTYKDLTSDVNTTVGITWPHNNTMTSAALLKATIALLKSRNPNTKVLLAVQQVTATNGQTNEPYQQSGWAGMTATHVANIYKFLQDMNMDGILIDYECLDATHDDLAHHCQTDPVTGLVSCYTDSEQVSVVKALRAGIPRPMKILLYGIHVGAYSQAPYQNAKPASWNGGYNLCLAKDADAVAALDGIHVGAYDAGGGYDPVVALDAFSYWFPTLPMYLGLRAGPPDAGGVKMTMGDIIQYANRVVNIGAAGCYCYSMLWDIVEPSGDVNFDWPDANMIAYAVASRYQLPQANRPLVAAQEGIPTNIVMSTLRRM